MLQCRERFLEGEENKMVRVERLNQELFLAA